MRLRELEQKDARLMLEWMHDSSVVGKLRNNFSQFIWIITYLTSKYAILESLMPNNATYILEKDWEEISQLTKTEVLSNKLHVDRIYHYLNWKEKIQKYLKRDEDDGKNKM